MSNSRDQFQSQGFVVIRGLLSPGEASRYRTEIQKLSGIGDADFGSKVFECPDGVSKNRPFWPLIDHPKLITAIRSLFGPAVRYTQHSDLHAHRGGVGWHRDSACRTFGSGPDWDESREPYQVVRVAIYLQNYAESRSSLGVIPGSHRFERRLTDDQWARWKSSFDWEFRWKAWKAKLGLGEAPGHEYPDRKMMMWTTSDPDPERDRPTPPLWIRTEPGDCIIFNQRLFHSASPIIGPKYAVYLSYSIDNEHGRNHLSYYRHVRKDLQYDPLAPELAESLKSKGLFMEVRDPVEIEGAFTNSS